jgi:hypothetical protein
MPLVYLQQKLRKDGKDCLEVKNINEQLQVPLPQNNKSQKNWILINVSILGTLLTDQFVKNLIVNMNQALSEFITEIYIKEAFTNMQDIN